MWYLSFLELLFFTWTFSVHFQDKPSPVRDLTVCDITAESATVKWEVPADDGGKPITGYIIEKRESGRRSFYEVGSTTELQFTVPELVEGNQYVFRVFAKNEIGKSEPVESDTITAKHPFSKLTWLTFMIYWSMYVVI